MPLYYLVCEKCGKKERHICTPERVGLQPCSNCENLLVRDPQPHPPSSQVTEVLDNGLMPKKLERLADAERLFKDRAATTKRKMMGEE